MNALFLKLLNMNAAGSVLILAVILLRALLRKAPRWIICLMWALVAVRLLCPVSIASPVSAFRATPAIVSESGELEVFRPAGGSEKPMLAVDTVQIERPGTRAETIREIPGTEFAVTQRSRDAYLPPLAMGWLVGVGAMLVYAGLSTWLLERKVRASLKLEGNVRLCDTIPSPFILGLARPTVYLPSGLSEEEKRFVLAHERAHLRRRDHWWKPLGFLILSIHWFNPLCWLAYVLLCRDIELACDEKVIRELGRGERAGYSQTLLNCGAHRVLAACPVAFGEVGVKTRVKAVLNDKRPAFWIVLAAVLGCIVLAVCLMTRPAARGQDLSFLNYRNAIPLIGQNDTAPYANLYPADSDGVQPGVADSEALALLLASADWSESTAPSSAPEERGRIEFLIEDDYRIILYQSERLAAVRVANDVRYYRIGDGDYEAALAAFIPSPSTEPDRPPEQSALPTPAPPPGLPEIDDGIVPADPEAFLLGFADAEIVSIYDEFSGEYAAPDKSFAEIISAESWTAHTFIEFPASIALRLIVMRSGDWELRIEDDGEDCLVAAYAVGRTATDPIIFFDCGENLMDELMAWALARQAGNTDNLPLGEYLKDAPESASAARLAVRLNDSSLVYLSVPAELAERIESKIETGGELPGILRVRMDGWGEQYAQGIDAPDLYYYPAYDRDRSSYLTILRNADGQYGIGGREADEEIRALLTLLQRETGWKVFSDPTDFADLTQIDVLFCGTLLTSVRDEAHLDAFEELIAEGSFAASASKTPNEIAEIRCTRADGSIVTLAADPEAARFWLPPFSYYRYDAYEQEPRTGALLKALGLDGWPSMDTVDREAVREMNERLLPTPEGW